MGVRVNYQLLGELRLAGEQDVVPIGARKVKTVLAALLIRANQLVSTDQLVAELWGEAPPRRALAGLHVYVSQLRKLLAGAGAGAAMVTRSPGYLIQVGSDDLDVLVVRRLAQKGRAAMRADRHDEASAAFRTALELWQGPVLPDLRHGDIVRRFADWAEQLQLECTEMLVECELALGRHRPLVGLLTELVTEHPMHEAFHRQLMLALYRCERRADALASYQSARETLVRELGLEPGRALRELQHAILHEDEIRLAV